MSHSTRPRSPGPTDNADCMLCGTQHQRAQLVPASALRPKLAEYIAQQHRDRWSDEALVCKACLASERYRYLMDRLVKERGELTAIEVETARMAADHQILAADVERQFQTETTPGQRVADRVAAIGGSWPFVVTFLVALVIWAAVNTFLLQSHAFDPYPYILLNLFLSCLAAIQAPIIMMSQNRVAARDRLQATQDYQVNLKAELEITSLHEKIDHLLHSQWQHLLELQELQLDLLTDLAREQG